MKLIATEALGMSWDAVNISIGIDTDLTTDTGGSGGSRQTDSGGWGVYDAALDVRRQLFAAAAAKASSDAKKANKPDPQVNPANLTIDGKFIKSTSDPSFHMSISSVVASTGTTIVGNGVHRNDGRWERSTFAAHAAEVEVDTLMGTVKVVNYVAVHDVGRVINGIGAEQQVEGGVNMSIGSSLYEELLTDQATGLPLNGNMLDYRVPSMKDVPEKNPGLLRREPQGIRRLRGPRPRRATNGSTRCHHRECGAQRRRRLVRRATDHPHAAHRRLEAVGLRKGGQTA